MKRKIFGTFRITLLAINPAANNYEGAPKSYSMTK